MSPRIRLFLAFLAIALFMPTLFGGSVRVLAQDSGGNLELHANSHASAQDIGLPAYPGATPYKEQTDHETDSAVDLGVSVGDFHMRLVAAKYMTRDSPAEVLSFYRKPLSRYGEVLECDHGKPVSSRTVTRSGLTCSDKNDNSDSSENHQLRAGSPKNYRIVAIDESHTELTRFDLVYLDLPKEADGNDKSK